MRRDPRLTIITEAIERLIPGATPAFLSVEVTETLPGTGERRNTWTGRPDAVAEQLSPLAQADKAKRARSIEGEISALMQAGVELTSAPWYPARPGDLVHVHYDQAGDWPAFGETYLVGDASEPGDSVPRLMSLTLLAHTVPATVDEAEVAGMTGCFAAEAADCPLYELWFEAGPQRLTIVRDGQVVHDGPARGRGQAATRILFEAERHAATMREVQRFLERGEPDLALARLTSGQPLPACGNPGPMPEHADCARPRGHRPPCSPDADYVVPPHECPALPEQLHAVVTVGSKVKGVHFAGLHGDRGAAVDQAQSFVAYSEEHNAQYVKPAAGMPGEMVLELPQENELRATGVQLAVVVPLQVLPDPRAEDEWAAEGMATALGPEDYADDYRDVDE
ncbi:hypothetical protein [Streptomyces sp. NPDC006132]|uniref:hypothetical protein n=1 Tax=Streptomyces sp. NPDC006132 TaxID=3156732 RepID=UPI0033FEA00B